MYLRERRYGYEISRKMWSDLMAALPGIRRWVLRKYFPTYLGNRAAYWVLVLSHIREYIHCGLDSLCEIWWSCPKYMERHITFDVSLWGRIAMLHASYRDLILLNWRCLTATLVLCRCLLDRFVTEMSRKGNKPDRILIKDRHFRASKTKMLHFLSIQYYKWNIRCLTFCKLF